MGINIAQRNNELKKSNFGSGFKRWFKSRYRKSEDEQRLSSFVEHLDKLSVLLGLDIYSIGFDNLRKLSFLSEDIFKECQSLQAEKNVNHIYALNNLIYYKIYENRPKLFQDYSDFLNNDAKNLTVGSALTYTTEAQIIAEKFSQLTFKKDLKVSLAEESDFIELLQQYINDKKNKIKFKGSISFDEFLKINYDK